MIRDTDYETGVYKCFSCNWNSSLQTSAHPLFCEGQPRFITEVEANVSPNSGRSAMGLKPVEVRTTSSTGGQKGEKAESFSLIPVIPLMKLARHYKRGAQKYARHQWRQGFDWDLAYDAAQRHMNLFQSGIDLDNCPDDGTGCSFTTFEGEPFTDFVPGETCYNHTGSSHLTCAVWMLFAIEEFRDTHPEHDKRYKRENS